MITDEEKAIKGFVENKYRSQVISDWLLELDKRALVYGSAVRHLNSTNLLIYDTIISDMELCGTQLRSILNILVSIQDAYKGEGI